MSAFPQGEARIDFRVPVLFKERIERAAQVQGRTLTDFAKEALGQKAEAVLQEHEHVRLSNRDRDIFLKAMEADPTPNAVLLADAERHRKHVVR